jgi:glycosyltransferase involved in cell wall biosynthesis
MLSGLVAQTQESSKWLSRELQLRHVETIPNPVIFPVPSDERAGTAGKDKRLVEAQHILLAVGRLEEQKGFDILLDAFAELAESYETWCLVIVGDGSERGKLLEKIEKLSLADRVYLPGVVENIGEWYRAADAYVLTSRFEGFPNTLLEAMAYGLAVVSVDCETGPNDIIRDNVDGLLVPQGNQEALVAALEKIMCDSDLRKSLSEHAVDIRDRYSINKIAGLWENLFQSIVNKSENH